MLFYHDVDVYCKCPKISKIPCHAIFAKFFMHLFHKMLGEKINCVDPDQTSLQEQSDLGLCCLHMSFLSDKLVYEIYTC